MKNNTIYERPEMEFVEIGISQILTNSGDPTAPFPGEDDEYLVEGLGI